MHETQIKGIFTPQIYLFPERQKIPAPRPQAWVLNTSQISVAMCKKIIFPILCLFLLGKGTLSAQCGSQRYLDAVFPQVNRTENILYANADPYGIIGGQDFYLDLYEPAGDTLAARPLIVFLHGSGFLVGDKAQPPIPDWAEYFARRGYVVASVGYRLGFNLTSGQSAERAVYRGVQDLRAALRFLAEFRQTYRLSLDHIVTAGTSAGCFAGLHSAFMQEADRPNSTYGIFLEPQDLGCADCSGNQFFNNQQVPVLGILNYWGAIGDTIWIDAAEQIPVLSIHGTADVVVPYQTGYPFSLPIFPTVQGSASITQRLVNLGIPNQLVTLYGAGHEPELTDNAYLDTLYEATVPFLYDLMRPNTPPIAGGDMPCAGSIGYYNVGPMPPGTRYCWTVTGGTVLYENGASIAVAWPAQLGTGSVSVQAYNTIDAPGLLQTLAVTLLPSPDLSVDAVSPTCFGAENGSLIALSTGLGAGTGFQWSNGQTGAQLNGLAAGTYTVTALNALGCFATATAILAAPAELSLSLAATPAIANDGTAAALPSGGTPPYQFTWNTGSSSDTLGQLPPGTYSVTVLDANGCSITDSVLVDSLPLTGWAGVSGGGATWRVFPNPSDGQATLALDTQFPVRVGLYAFDGRRVGSWWIAPGEPVRVFDLSALPGGIYFWVLFSAENGRQSQIWHKK